MILKKTFYFDKKSDRLVKRLARRLSGKTERVSESEVIRQALTVLPYDRMVDAIRNRREQ